MSDSSANIKDSEAGYNVELNQQNPPAGIQDNEFSALITENINSIEFGRQSSQAQISNNDFDAVLTQNFGSEIIREPYPGFQIDYFYTFALATSFVNSDLRAIFALIASCFADSEVIAILTQNTATAFSTAFSSAFR
jgi:hypothetical protein